LPALAEQRRIVEALEDHLSRLDAADSNAHRAEAQLAALDSTWICRHPILSSAPRRRLGELLAEPLSNGRSVPDGDGFPVLRLTCLRDGRVDLAERKRGRWSADDAARYLVAPGDFLVARGNGSLRLVGIGAIVDEPRVDPVAYPDTLIRVRPQRQLLEPHLLTIVWNSAIVRRQLEGMARTTAGIYKVNQRHLESVELPVPALAEQHTIVADAQQQRDATQRLRGATRSVIDQSNGLRRALLAAAFTGRLTRRASDEEVVQELAGV
jgi:type I restriction enzyme S subunit